MKRLWCVAVLPMLMLSSGCASQKPNQAQVRLTGIVAKSKAGPTYAFADFDLSTYRGNRFRRKLETHKRLITTQYLKLEVSQHGPIYDHDFFVVFGPNPNAPHKPASVRILNSEVTTEVTSGWAYLDGDNPNGKSDWVSAGAQGTKIVLRIVNDTTQEVYLLASNAESAEVKVTCNNGNPGQTFNNAGQAGWFVRIQSGCVISAPAQIGSDPDAQAFITAIGPIIVEAQ